MTRNAARRHFPALLALASLLLPAATADARPAFQREYLTPREVERVRDNQQLDKRVGVFVKAAERRLQMITDPQAASKESAKAAAEKEEQRLHPDLPDFSEYSDAVTGTRAQLLADIANILDEAITNVDDAAIHSEKSGLIPKAVRKLADSCARMLPRLEALRSGVTDEAERGQLEQAIENAQQIVTAAKKVPTEEEEKAAKKAEKKKSEKN
ncbi:MAG TPA: hypothetical protein VER32_09035 [Pyrinomonadaceae bacterium]|nr:hypothetical protein [Pyrinomonadaceae bacterium]